MNTYFTSVASRPALKVLIMGGDHTYGHGLPFGQGFVQRTLAELEQAGYQLQPDYYAPVTMGRLVDLQQHNAFIFHRYDLVLIQVGHIELMNQSLRHLLQTRTDINTSLYQSAGVGMSWSDEPVDIQSLAYQPRTSPKNRLHHPGERLTGRLVTALSQWPVLPYLNRVVAQLRQVMRALNGCQDRVILIAPLPTADPVTNALRCWGAGRWQEEAERNGFTLINPGAGLLATGRCWLADGYHLNAGGHERLYRGLRTEIARLLAAEAEWGHLNEVPY